MEDKNILLVEDDTSLGYLLSEYLGMKGFKVVWAKNGNEALRILGKQPFNLAILDVMMPEMDGFTLAAKINDNHPGLLFLFLTARSMKIDVLKGFALGAVDYLKKPIDEEELVVRLDNLLKRLQGAKGNDAAQPETVAKSYAIGKYVFTPANLSLARHGNEITLTTRENELLLYLANRKNQLCSHKDILMALWGKNDYFNRKSLNVFISHLRKYLEQDPSISIENIHNQGFVLKY